MIVSGTLAALLATCAPHVGPVTMAALVAHESGGNPLAIGDNSTRRSYAPASRAEAEALARRLLAARHRIDVGYAQVDSDNFAAYGLDVHAAFEPCTNLNVGSAVLRHAYRAAATRYGKGRVALAHALSAYNTGGFWAGLDYARAVYAASRSLRWTLPARRTVRGLPR